MTSRLSPDWALLRRLLGEARPYLPHIIGLFVIGLLATPLALLSPLPLKIAVDSALGSHPIPRALRPLGVASSPAVALAVAVGLLVATALLKQLQEVGSRVLRAFVLERLTLDLRARLFRHAQRLSLSHHDRQGTADSVYRIQNDVPAAQSIVVESIFPSVAAAVSLAGMLVVTARLDWQLALAGVAISPLVYLVNQSYRRRFRLRWREAKDLESSAQSVVQEVLGALRVVKVFGQEHREHHRFLRRSSQGMSARLRLTTMEGGFGMLVSLLMAVGTALVLFLGIRHVQAGVLTLGELLLLMGYLTQLYEPLKTLSRKVTGMQSRLTSAERVFALLDNEPDVVERTHARPLGRAHGRIAFEQVSFSYPGDRLALRDVTFEMPVGARMGIVGPTGAGKTTLLGLLLRFSDPASGRILLDGVDIRDYRLDDLRRQYATVLQDPVLFSSSVAENIAYARPEAARPEIEAAAKAAGAHDFIVRLPQGYDTPVGERGMSLSGGERQRISLARAFLKDAPILILDEPTSAVDLRTEALIVEALGRLMRGRTTLLVTHRLGLLDDCDLRLELAHGQSTTAARPARDSLTG